MQASNENLDFCFSVFFFLVTLIGKNYTQSVSVLPTIQNRWLPDPRKKYARNMLDSKNLKITVQSSKNQNKNKYTRTQTHIFGKIWINI
jgi:hypothetical protein